MSKLQSRKLDARSYVAFLHKSIACGTLRKNMKKDTVLIKGDNSGQQTRIDQPLIASPDGILGTFHIVRQMSAKLIS